MRICNERQNPIAQSKPGHLAHELYNEIVNGRKPTITCSKFHTFHLDDHAKRGFKKKGRRLK